MEELLEPTKKQFIPPNQFRDALEEQLNKWANSICSEYRIHKDTFRINLVNPEPSLYPIISRVTNAAVVNIALTLPWVDKGKDVNVALLASIKAMKKAIRSIFKYLSKPSVHGDDELFNPLIISDRVHEYIKGAQGTRTWQRGTYNPLSIRRQDFGISVRHETRVTVTHKRTKTAYTISGVNRTEYDLIKEALEKCIERMEAEKAGFASLSEGGGVPIKRTKALE
jgi:hypothetical protein